MTGLRDVKPILESPFILDILAQSTYMPTPEKMAADALSYKSDNATNAFGWFENDTVSGVIVVRLVSGCEAEIKSISVTASYRGLGIGARLIQNSMEALHIDKLAAETDDDAVGFYRKCGFAIKDLGMKYENTRRYECCLVRRKCEK